MQLGGSADRIRWLPASTALEERQAAPAMYRAIRPHWRHLSVTCERGGAGTSSGVRSMAPEQDGQLSGVPVRSFEIRFSACAGLYVAGRGLRMRPLLNCNQPRMNAAPVRLMDN